jgi:type IV pilus assembly protein PilW
MTAQAPAPSRSQRRQAGLGLVEMLVAIVIGLFILAGLVSVFVNMKQAFVEQDQLAQLQDSERLVLTILTTTVQTAAYYPDPLTSTVAADLPAATGSYWTFAAGQGIVGQTGTAPASDTITSRYMTATGSSIMDCLGNVNTSGANLLVMNTFSVNAANQLQCSNDGGTTQTILVSGVTSMTVLYGTDTTNSGSTTQYLNAAAVTAGAYWGQVRTVQVTVSLVNPFAAQTGQPPSISWTHTISLMNRL